MPRKPINYANTKIYKLVCKNLEIKRIYIGHTTNWFNRNHSHRVDCHCENSKNYNIYVYKFIRENGGFDNWDMILIEDFPCDNVLQASQRERYWIEELNADLNIQIPSRTTEEYSKMYNNTHKEEYKQYYQEHKEERLQYLKQYQEENYEKLNQKKREYYHKNIELIKQKNKQRINCECGLEVSHSNLGRHRKSQKHLKLIESKVESI